MIIWINGSFGAGKTTLSKKLNKVISNSIIFDPEQVGFIIHKSNPDSKSTDFQKFSIWRHLVIEFIKGFKKEFDQPMIIPMALVDPEYQKEIFSAISEFEQKFFHFYLDIDEMLLRDRISQQTEMSDETNNWRLQQVSRCLKAKQTMPANTVFLNSGQLSPSELTTKILEIID